MEEIVLKEEDVPGAYLSKDPAEYSMAVLRRWLECHGQKKGGRKQDLIDRVRGCIVIKTKVDPKIDGGKWYSFKNQSSSQSTASSTASAVSSSMAAVSSWKPFPSLDIQEMFNYGHAYHYLFESISQFGCGEWVRRRHSRQQGRTKLLHGQKSGTVWLTSMRTKSLIHYSIWRLLYRFL